MNCKNRSCHWYDLGCIINCKLFKNDIPEMCIKKQKESIPKRTYKKSVIDFKEPHRPQTYQINDEIEKIQLTLDYFTGTKIKKIAVEKGKTCEGICYIIKQVKYKYLGLKDAKVSNILYSPRLQDHIQTLERDMLNIKLERKNSEKLKQLENLS